MNVTCLTALLTAVGAMLLSIVPSPALAEPPPGETAVPVEQASFHQLVFADDDVAVLNNLYPPKGDSGFHTHYRDLFAVIVQPSPTSSQAPGKPLSEAPAYPLGAVAYSAVGDAPRTHRVVNGGENAFQAIVVELRRPNPLGDAVSSRDGAPGYEPIIDNPRMRAWRLILAPGQSVPSIVQANKGVRIVVRGGLLTTTTAGGPDQRLTLRPGDFAIQPAGATRALSNRGTETIELVELELK